MKKPLALIQLACLAVIITLFGVGAGVRGAEWSQGASMPTARSELAVAELDGRIYVAGGIGQWGTSDAFEAYDTAKGVWTRLAPLPKATHHPAMAALNGRVYLSGGYADILFRRVLRGMWAYDPDANSWHRVASMPERRAAHKLVSLDGKLYAIGGREPNDTPLWSYDPVANRWDTSHAPLPTGREHLATAVAGGMLYVIGGRKRDHVNLATVEAYDPQTDTWTRKADLPSPRGGHAAATLGGHIHVAGGEDIDAGEVFAEQWIYDPDADHWRPAPPIPTARHGVDSAASAGKWYVVGGGTAAGYWTIVTLTDRVEVFSLR